MIFSKLRMAVAGGAILAFIGATSISYAWVNPEGQEDLWDCFHNNEPQPFGTVDIPGDCRAAHTAFVNAHGYAASGGSAKGMHESPLSSRYQTTAVEPGEISIPSLWLQIDHPDCYVHTRMH